MLFKYITVHFFLSRISVYYHSIKKNYLIKNIFPVDSFFTFMADLADKVVKAS